jgi:hypothetical protein
MLYFAYGSNLCLARLRDRVPSVEFVAVASLEGYALRWHKRSNKDGSGKFSVVEAAESSVPGALFAIPASEKLRLDRAEGLNYGYDEREVTVSSGDERHRALTYVASPSHIDDSLLPLSWYRDLTVDGATRLGLPREHIAFLRSIPTAQDEDAEREADERRFLPCGG